MIIQQKCDNKATYISTGFRKRGSWREKGEGKLKEKKKILRLAGFGEYFWNRFARSRRVGGMRIERGWIF